MSDWQKLREVEWRRLLAERGMAGGLQERIASYLALLGRWQRVVNLVGGLDAGGVVDELVVESLAGAVLLPGHGTVLDIGSGNGSPAVPLLVASPEIGGVLLEPRERRWAFLREVVRELRLPAEVRRERLEEHRATGYAALTVRGVGVETWGERASAHVVREGPVLWWTTHRAASGARPAGLIPVVESPLPAPERGVIAVWRRCST